LEENKTKVKRISAKTVYTIGVIMGQLSIIVALMFYLTISKYL